MAFADFKPDYEPVLNDAGKTVGEVRPLNDVDFSLVWRKHSEAMSIVFETFMQSQSEGASIDFQAIAGTIATTVPDLLTDVICIASDETDHAAVFKAVSLMPIGLRISTLNTILRVTSEAEGGLVRVLHLIKNTRPRAAVPSA